MLITRITAILLTAVFALGVFMYAGRMVETHHTMHDGTSHHVCPGVGTTPACVSVFEHIEHWQHAFMGVLAELFLVLAFLCVAALCTAFFQWFRFSPPLRWQVTPGHSLLTRHYLQEAFARGVLHSKAF